MEHKRLQLLVPQYKETEDVIKFLLDSVEYQVLIDKKDVGVIICSDGGEYILDRKFLDKYSYDIDYVVCPHRGVSSTRNSAFYLSDSDYVMYCDADDGFCNSFAIKIIFENIDISERENTPFDLLTTKFYCERRENEGVKGIPTGNIKWGLTIGDHNNIFIHGRVFKREFLIKNFLYFDERIMANEDSYFNIVTSLYAKNSTKALDVPIYCWRSTAGSVSNDPDFITKSLHWLIHSNDSVIETMLIMKMDEKEIAKCAFDIISKVYLDMNSPHWFEERFSEYRDITLKTLQWYINKRGKLCECLSDNEKKLVLQNARSTPHYRNIESISFNDFINYVMNYGKEEQQD